MDECTKVSAHHNHLVGGMLQDEVLVESSGGFFFHAHRLGGHEDSAKVSGCVFDPEDHFLVRFERNDMLDNPWGFTFVPMGDGWALMSSEMKAILSAQTLGTKHGLITIFRGALHNAMGRKVVLGGERGLEIHRASEKARSASLPGIMKGRLPRKAKGGMNR